MAGISEPLFVACCEKANDVIDQACFMPVDLMLKLKCKFEDVIYIEVGEKGLICKVFPKFPLGCNPLFEVVASRQVMHNVSHLKDFNCEEFIKLSMHNVTLLTVKDILEISVSVIMVSVNGVLKSKECSDRFKKEVKSLLQLYNVIDNTIISCLSNPLAEFLGISYIIVNNTLLSNDKGKVKFVGKIISETKITILNIESEERHFSLVKNYSLLGGLEPVLTDLKNMIVTRWNNSANMNFSGGVLLVGPPGCGKSSIVRQLCYETKASYISTAAAEIQSPFEGETLRNFEKVSRKAFSLSREGPCIFFIDEIDSIGLQRTEESNMNDLHLTNLVLCILDECKKYPFLLIMAATNRPYTLDKSLLSTGRLDLEILLSAPTLNQRKEILDIYCKGLFPDSHSILSDIATATPGYVGADLKFLCERVKEKCLLKESSTNIDPSIFYEEMIQLLNNFPPSIHKSLDFFTEKPKFSPIGGLKDIRRKLDIIFLAHSKFDTMSKKSGLKKPKGILFYGPRGCGKTRLVSHIASQKGYSFISANASHLLSSYVGESEKRVAALFHSARLTQPSIIFIDEIDGIFGSRENSSKGVKVNLITELLQAMDGGAVGVMSRQGSTKMNNYSGDIRDDILVCAATNHPEKLDSALIRPGRFDHLLYIPPPDEEERFEILKLKSSSLKIDEKILQEIAARSERWTGAELENFINGVVFKSLSSNHVSEDGEEIIITEEILWKEFNYFSPSLLPKDLTPYKQFAEKFK